MRFLEKIYDSARVKIKCQTDVGEITLFQDDLEMRTEPLQFHHKDGMDMHNSQTVPYYKEVRINSYEIVVPEKTFSDMITDEIDKEVVLENKQVEKKSKKYIIPVIMIGSFIGYKVLRNVFW